jgi:peptidoglycan hydrolase-like protein with peptidoglycan-binding domain
MFRKTAILLLPALIISLSGCASARKKDLQGQALKNQISVLEAQIQSKDQEISNLKDTLNKPAAEKKQVVTKKSFMGEVKSRPKARQIQTALKNAGYYSGAIDGKVRRVTREAIKAFQKANNLSADGKVGKQTWELLRKYLYLKVK